jgi:ribosomal protein L11 methyltransferase
MSIDWHQQWAKFAPNFEHGLSTVNLDPFERLLLAPGAGFGDLSHPTTRLMIELMKNRCEKQIVLDIGCGSGILTLAAARMGGAHAHGLDIDPLAIQHAQENQKLNRLTSTTSFSYSWEKNPTLVLMNMITSEQQAAWAQQKLPPTPKTIIASGVLVSQREQYLTLASGWNWALLEERFDDGWLAFVFRRS